MATAVFLPLLACSGHSAPASSSSTTAPEPVAECQQYEQEFARCSGIAAAISTQPKALASNDADRARLKTLCSSNLARLRQSCR
jgi:hypothetical protein